MKILRNYAKLAITLLMSVHSSVYAASILDITPSSTAPIVIATNGQTYLSYIVKNNTSKTINEFSIQPGNSNNQLMLSINHNECTSLAPSASCTFVLNIKGNRQTANVALSPTVCAYHGAICSVPIAGQRVTVIASTALPSSSFPVPYAGTFYPLYNAGIGQWIPPTLNMPFNKISAIFAAFAHAYPQGNGAIFTFERGQPAEPERLALLAQTARQLNPSIKILISLGWGKHDWDYINQDYENRANVFVPSVIQFIRINHLDGVDIDNEGIGDDSGDISQTNFDGVIANLRNALNYASLQDGKPYYLTITPAGNNIDDEGGISGTQVDAQNASSFNLINIQTYYDDPSFSTSFLHDALALGYPLNQISNGISTEHTGACNLALPIPAYQGYAGLFNWTMTADSDCNNFQYTKKIAMLVGYSA